MTAFNAGLQTQNSTKRDRVGQQSDLTVHSRQLARELVSTVTPPRSIFEFRRLVDRGSIFGSGPGCPRSAGAPAAVDHLAATPLFSNRVEKRGRNRALIQPRAHRFATARWIAAGQTAASAVRHVWLPLRPPASRAEAPAPHGEDGAPPATVLPYDGRSTGTGTGAGHRIGQPLLRLLQPASNHPSGSGRGVSADPLTRHPAPPSKRRPRRSGACTPTLQGVTL